MHNHLKLTFAVFFLFIAVVAIGTAAETEKTSISPSAQPDTVLPTSAEILATQAAIRKEGDRVPHETYRRVVPAYVSKNGKLTDQGEAIIDGGDSNSFEITIADAPVKVRRTGDGPQGVIIFGHSGSHEMVKYLQQNREWLGDIPEKCSLFLWEYPSAPPFDQVQATIQSYREDNTAKLAIGGIASNVVSQIRQKTGLKEFLIVGNSLGAGIVLQDYATLVRDKALTFLLVSPTEPFMPPPEKIPTLERTVLIGSKGLETGNGDLRFSTDLFLKGMDEKPEAKAWHWFRKNNNEEWGDLITASRAAEPTEWKTRPDGSKYHMALPTDFETGHKTIGGDINAELLGKLLRVKLGWADKAILAETPKQR